MLKIAKSIKTQRKKLGITQGQLAARLNVSAAAVCKWESGNANPDISLLIPLSQMFNISVDELLGADQIEIEQRIDRTLEEYRTLSLSGQKSRAALLIEDAKNRFPTDHRILIEYMWSIVGGRNTTDRGLLVNNRAEVMEICRYISSTCLNERIRYEALLMNAKILFVSNQCDEAIKLLDSLPRWADSFEQQMELLYDTETDDALYWVRRNIYSLADGIAFKITKTIWNKRDVHIDSRATELLLLSREIHNCWERTNQIAFIVMEHMVLSVLVKKYMIHNYSENIAREALQQQLIVAKEISCCANSDNALKDSIIKTYKTEDLYHYTIDYYRIVNHPSIAKICSDDSILHLFGTNEKE